MVAALLIAWDMEPLLGRSYVLYVANIKLGLCIFAPGDLGVNSAVARVDCCKNETGRL